MERFKEELRRRILVLAPDREQDAEELVQWAEQEVYRALGLLSPAQLDEIVRQGEALLEQMLEGKK